MTNIKYPYRKGQFIYTALNCTDCKGQGMIEVEVEGLIEKHTCMHCEGRGEIPQKSPTVFKSINQAKRANRGNLNSGVKA